MRRIVLLGAVALAVVVAVMAYRVISSIDTLVARALEQQVSALTGTAVEVKSVEISLSSGRGTVRGLTVANPPGFESPRALALGEITLEIDASTLTANPVVLKEVVIGEAEVFYELNAEGKSNIDILRKHVKQADAATSAGRGSGETRDTAGAEEPLRFAVRKFTFRAGRAHADTRAVGGKELDVPLPSETLANLGGSRGAEPSEIGREVFRAYTSTVVTTVATRQIHRELDELIDDKAGKAGEAVKGMLDRLLQ